MRLWSYDYTYTYITKLPIGIIQVKFKLLYFSVHLRDYATKKSENLEPLLQKLDSEVRRFGRITKRDIDEVFDELRAKNDITSSQSLLVIRCCGMFHIFLNQI